MKRTQLTALLVISALLASCGSTASSEQTTAAESGSSADTTESSSASYLDQMPDADYGGRAVRFGVSETSEPDIAAEELNGDVTNDAMWRRNNKIEEKFNIKIESTVAEADIYQWYPKIQTLVLAGEDVYDIVGHFAFEAHSAISAGIYQDWSGVKNLELDNPWWAEKINADATFNGKLYGLSGYIGMSMMQYSQAMFFNQRYVEEYGTTADELYDTVYDGSWTFEKFEGIVKNMYVDLNKNDKRDEDDFCGYCFCGGGTYDYWQYAFDIPVTIKNKDGSVKIDLMNDKRVSALEAMNNLLKTNQGVNAISKNAEKSSWNWYDQYNFSQGKQAFSGGPFLGAFELYRDMNDTYGVLPFPKWDEQQENYIASINDRYIVWGIPMTVKDTAFVGLVVEAMARETYENVYPAFYDVALKGKFSTDDHYADMVDIVMSGMCFDIGNMFYDYTAKAAYVFRNLIKEGSTDLASRYASIESEIKAGLEKFNTFYAD